jgi:trehalose synthase
VDRGGVEARKDVMDATDQALTPIEVLPLDPDRFRPFVADPVRWQQLAASNERGRSLLENRALWNVTTTSRIGGVAVLVRSYTAYARGAGIDSRWEVVDGDYDFFRLAKRLHNDLHGAGGLAAGYTAEDRELYEATLLPASRQLADRLRPGDIVVLHGAETAGLAEAVREAGAHPVWRCHVGTDVANGAARSAWEFLDPYVRAAEVTVFSRREFIWESIDPGRAFVIAPVLNPLSPRNETLNPAVVEGILKTTGFEQDGPHGDTTFVRMDGTAGRVDRRARVTEVAPLPRDAQLIVQVSAWNRLKDPVGVVDAFARSVAPRSHAHLVIAGPEADPSIQEPEAQAVLHETLTAWRDLPLAIRSRVHVAEIPIDDPEEAAATVNALQTRASVILQKSRGEGFGMTVLEAMWKERPVVCTRVGGLQEQVVDGVTGFLVEPGDDDDAGTAICRLLVDAELSQRMGTAGHERVREHFLLPQGARRWGAVIDSVLGDRAPAAT